MMTTTEKKLLERQITIESLDKRLPELLDVINRGDFKAVRSLAKKIANEAAEQKGQLNESHRKLLRAEWENTWKRSKRVSSGWFEADCLDNESADALYDAFVQIVRYVVDAKNERKQKLFLPDLKNKVLDYLELRDDNLVPDEGKQSKEETAKKQLTVSIEKITATLDGKEYDLKSEYQARWLKVYAEHPGEWISGPRLEEYDSELSGSRTDRLRSGLPQEIESLIETSKRKGARLKLD